MIGKVVKPGNGFRGVVNYLLRGKRKSKDNHHRVQWTMMRNMLIDDIDLAPSLMRATAAKSKRVKNPVYHYIISWPKAFTPTADMMREVADTTCLDLGLEDYQRLYVGHDDTDHRHVHIVVNRVHPETGIAWRASKDYETIEVSLRRQAENYGMDYVPGRHNSKEFDKERSRRPRDRDFRKPVKEGQGVRVPAGRWSKERIRNERERLGPLFAMSHSWEALDTHLASLGYQLDSKGQGIVIHDALGSMKLSELGKDIRLATLEERFGITFKEFDRTRFAREMPEPQRETPQQAKERRRQPEHREPTRAASGEAPVSELQKRWAAYSEASDHTEMSLILYRMGFISRTDLDRSFADLDNAQAIVARSRSLLDQLSDIDWHKRQEQVEKARRLRAAGKIQSKARGKDRSR